jgi:hypothetical protein
MIKYLERTSSSSPCYYIVTSLGVVFFFFFEFCFCIWTHLLTPKVRFVSWHTRFVLFRQLTSKMHFVSLRRLSQNAYRPSTHNLNFKKQIGAFGHLKLEILLCFTPGKAHTLRGEGPGLGGGGGGERPGIFFCFSV